MIKNVIIGLLVIALAVTLFHNVRRKPANAPTVSFKYPDLESDKEEKELTFRLQIAFGKAFVKQPSCKGVVLVTGNADWTVTVFSEGSWSLIKASTGDTYANGDGYLGRNGRYDLNEAKAEALRADWSDPAREVCGIVMGAEGGGIDKRFSQFHISPQRP